MYQMQSMVQVVEFYPYGTVTNSTLLGLSHTDMMSPAGLKGCENTCVLIFHSSLHRMIGGWLNIRKALRPNLPTLLLSAQLAKNDAKGCKMPTFLPFDPEGPEDCNLVHGPKIDWFIFDLRSFHSIGDFGCNGVCDAFKESESEGNKMPKIYYSC